MRTGQSFRFQAALAAAAMLCVGVAPPPALASDAPLPFEAPDDSDAFQNALQCLTAAVYYEARSESDDGQRAVAQVVLNRVRHRAYPNSVCGVVYQGSHRRTGCQFTFTCDGSVTGRVDGAAWARAQRIARAALRGDVYRPVGLSLNYHTTAIRPYWAPSLVRKTVVGAHIFYLRPDSATLASFRQAPSAVEPGTGHVATRTLARTSRGPADRSVSRYETARVEVPRVERPTVQRARIERPAFVGPVSSRVTQGRAAAASSRAQSRPQARPAAAPRGPRTTIENGVRVARGS